MPSSEYQPYPVLLEGLVASITRQLSGTLLIATHDNASCRFAIEQGCLTHCTFSRLHGEEALIAFTNTPAGRYSFNDMRYPFRAAATVVHERAVAILGLPPLDTTSPSSPKTPKPVSGSQFTKEEMEALFGKFYFE